MDQTRPLVAFMVAVSTLVPCTARSQDRLVQGALIEAGSDRPVSTAAVFLLAESGPVAVTLSDAAGRFRMFAPAGGEYTLRVDRIGFESQQSEPFSVPPEGVSGLTMRVRVRPIELDPLSVSAARVCDLGDSPDSDLLMVWSEARKALTSTMVGARTGARRFIVELSERELERGLEVRSERVDTIVTVADHGVDFAPMEELRLSGWGRVEGEVMTRFYGPSPEALLSSWFGSNHCLSLVRNGEAGEEFGLAFESIDDVMTIGIEGVFWIDPEDWHLRRIEFRFTGDRELERAREQGGVVELAVDDEVGWYVREWRLRSPILAPGRLDWLGRGGSVVTATRRYRVTGYQEKQGRVIGFAN